MDRNNNYSELATKIDESELATKIDEIGSAFEQFTDANDAALSKKANGEAFSEIEAKVTRIHDDLAKLEQEKRSIERKWEADRARIEQFLACQSVIIQPNAITRTM